MKAQEAWKRGIGFAGASVKLLFRLATDPRVDIRRRLGAGLAIAYAASPIDLIPDGIPILGKVDDLAVAAAAIKALLDGAEDDLLAEHWDGDPRDLEALRGVFDAAAGMVPKRFRWVQEALGPVRAET